MKTVVIEIERVQFAEAVVEVPDDWTDRELLTKDLKNTYGLDWETDTVDVVGARQAGEDDDCLPSLEYVI